MKKQSYRLAEKLQELPKTEVEYNGIIRAYRGHTVNAYDASLKGVYADWASASKTATCGDSPERALQHIRARGNESAGARHLGNHRPDCRCGINGLWTHDQYSTVGGVMTVNVFWGEMELGAKGVRAEHSKMEIIYLPDHPMRNSGRYQARDLEELSQSREGRHRLLIGLALRYLPQHVRIIYGMPALQTLPSFEPVWDEIPEEKVSDLLPALTWGERLTLAREKAGTTRSQLMHHLEGRYKWNSRYYGRPADYPLYNILTRIEGGKATKDALNGVMGKDREKNNIERPVLDLLLELYPELV